MSDPDLWERYLERLQLLRQEPDGVDSGQRSAGEARARAFTLADRAVADSEQFGAEADRRIEQALLGARQALLEVGEQGRVPPRMRPSAVPPSAGRDDVYGTLGDLDDAVAALRVAIRAAKSEPSVPAPAERSAPPPSRPTGEPSPPSQRPPRRPLLIGIGSAAVIVAVAVALLAALTTH